MTKPQTSQRRAIETAIASAAGPVSPAAVFEAARQEIPKLSIATVYRTLKRMVDAGEITPVKLAGQPPRYEPSKVANHHHHHFWCQECDTVFDVEGCVEGLRKLLPAGFRMTSHEITLHGLCRKCGPS